LAQNKIEDAKSSLVRLLEARRPQGSLNNSVTIVFDGHSGNFGQIPSSTVKIIFSQEESADDRIKRIVLKSTLKKNIVVVTNDKDIKFSVRAQGARVMSVDEFMYKIIPGQIDQRKQAKHSRPEREDVKHIPQTLEYKITAEFEKIWLEGSGRSPKEKLNKNFRYLRKEE